MPTNTRPQRYRQRSPRTDSQVRQEALPGQRSAPSPAAGSPARPKRSRGALGPSAPPPERSRAGRAAASSRSLPSPSKASPRKESRSRSPVTLPQGLQRVQDVALHLQARLQLPHAATAAAAAPRCAYLKSAPPQPAPVAPFRGAAGPLCNLRPARRDGPLPHAASAGLAIEPRGGI